MSAMRPYGVVSESDAAAAENDAADAVEHGGVGVGDDSDDDDLQ